MIPERPDLQDISPAVRAYIEALEEEVARLQEVIESLADSTASDNEDNEDLEPSEPPTTTNIVVVSQRGMIKRTPRHHYSRQHRGGMGIFDLDTGLDDPPAFLCQVEESEALLLITNEGHSFRLPLIALPELPVRSRGINLRDHISLPGNERVSLVLPANGGSYLALVTDSGQVRRFSAHYFREGMKPGLLLYDVAELGRPAAACWTAGDEDLFVATQNSQAIRFAEKQVPVRGCLGIRLAADDVVVAVAAVGPQTDLFLLGADGKGTIRQMAGFKANKGPGAGGKLAMKTDKLVAAVTVEQPGDLFIITQLSKLIRFQADEVPAKGGVVQGVNCIALRRDEAVCALAV